MTGAPLLGPGELLGGYRVSDVLGAGGMGVVYRATQLSLDREVALKVLSPELAPDREARERFVQEGVLAARVTHPHIVAIFEVGQEGDRLYLAYELMRGETLRARLGSRGTLDVEEATEIAADCAGALAALHENGILHRDLKPENVFVEPSRGALLSDLGIAKDILREGIRTREGLILGTPAYIAPELIRGERATPAADLYALGVMLFECLAGRPPYADSDPRDLLRSHVKAPVPALRHLDPGLPQDLDDLVRSALAKDPADRPASASSFRSALLRKRRPPTPRQAAASSSTIRMARPIPEAERQPDPRSSRAEFRSGRAELRSGRAELRSGRARRGPGRRLLGVSLTVVVVAAVGGGAYLWREPPSPGGVAPGPVTIEAPEARPETAERAVADPFRQALEEAQRQVGELGGELDRQSEHYRRNLASLRPEQVVDDLGQLWSSRARATELALTHLEALSPSSRPESRAAAGKLVLELSGEYERTRKVANEALDLVEKSRSSVVNLFDGVTAVEGQVTWLWKRIGPQARRLAEKLPASIAGSPPPEWLAARVSMLAAARATVSGPEMQALLDECLELSGRALETLTAPERDNELDDWTTRRLMEALRHLDVAGRFQLAERFSRRVDEVDARGPRRLQLALVHFILQRTLADGLNPSNDSIPDASFHRQNRLAAYKRNEERLRAAWPLELTTGRPPLPEGASRDDPEVAAALRMHGRAHELHREAVSKIEECVRGLGL